MNRLLFAAGAMLLLAACAKEPAEAEADLCAELSRLRQTVADFPATTTATTVQEVRAGRERLHVRVEEVRDAARKLGEVRTDDLEAAYSDLDQEVASLPASADVGTAAATLRAKLAEVESAREALYELHCGGRSATTDDGPTRLEGIVVLAAARPG